MALGTGASSPVVVPAAERRVLPWQHKFHYTTGASNVNKFILKGCRWCAPVLFAMGSLLGTPACAAIPDIERQVLLDMYDATAGAAWTNHSNWYGPAGSECTWYGVSCDAGHAHVVGINLYNNNLILSNAIFAPPMPAISPLANLQSLRLGSNHLIGSLTWLAGLAKLSDLDVSRNQLSGSLSVLMGLTNLQFFNGFSNQFTGSIPSLAGLANLQVFVATTNQLSGSIPSLTGLVNLTDFEVGNNQLSGSIPSLSGLTALLAFDVSSNQLTGTIPPLAGLASLMSFQAHDNQLTGPIPPLNEQANLQVFNADNTQLTGSIPSLAGHVPLLEFRVYANQLSGMIPSLAGLTSLQTFDVGGNQLTGTIPALAGLQSLQILDVSSNQLTGSIPTLAGLANLQGLYVSTNHLTGPIPPLAGLTNLQGFGASYNQLSGSIPPLTGLINLVNFLVEHNQLTGDPPAIPTVAGQTLAASSSRLCPNFLNQTASSDWNYATGITPWYTYCTPHSSALNIQAARKVSEGAPFAQLRVDRALENTGAISVDYSTVDRTASAGSDYLPTSGTLSWAAGDSTPKFITVPIVQDAQSEATETFNVLLQNPTGPAVVVNGVAVVTITDDDPATPFADSASSYFLGYINAIFGAGITTGCGSNHYCPSQNVTRDQMAAFLIRAKEGEPTAGYCAATPPFADVAATNSFCGYIKRLSELGITTGCGSGNYCPGNVVTRDQMAAFLVRAVEGEPAAAYCGSTAPFNDVPASNSFCGYIKRLSELGITTGCGSGNYCPAGSVTREQMAAFLARAFLGMM